MLRCPWSVLFSNSSRLRVCSVNSNISWLWFHLSLTHFFKYRKEIQVLDYVLEFWRGSSNHSMLVLNWARTGSQNFVSCCQNVALLVPLHWWWWWRWWWLLSTDDDEIFIKFPPHANQLAQDHPLRSRWSEGDKKITGSTKKLLCTQVCFLGGLGIAQWAWNDWPSDGFTADWIIQIHRGLLTTCCFTTFVQLLLSRFVCIQAVWPTQKTSMSWPKKKRHGTPPTKKVDFAN